MKRIAALLLLLMLLCSAALAEQSFVPPIVPEFTPAYGLYEFYTDLQTTWGPPHLWTLEQKAWLSAQREPMLEQEIIRCNALGWHAKLPFTLLLCHYTHGLPDDQAISQDDALNAAIAYLEAQGLHITPNGRKYAGASYLTDHPDQPVWRLSFLEQSFDALLWMDARTGGFSRLSSQQVIDLGWQHIVDAGIKVAGQPLTMEHLNNYTAIPYYRPADSQWDVLFIGGYPSYEFTVTLSDSTQEVLSMTATNG